MEITPKSHYNDPMFSYLPPPFGFSSIQLQSFKFHLEIRLFVDRAVGTTHGKLKFVPSQLGKD